MTKAEVVANISRDLGIDKADVSATVEAFMQEVKQSLINGEHVYLRGFGSFIIKTRAKKVARNISANVSITLPAHNIPVFKPSRAFVEDVKNKVKLKR